MIRLFFAVFSLWLILGMTPPVQAQLLSSVTGGSQSEEDSDTSSELAKALEQAAEAGVSVVVVDPGGAVLGQTPATSTTAPGPGMGGDMTGLMVTYKRVETFIDRLEDRLAALPGSVAEVDYILKATSPNGQISAYIQVLLSTLILLALGRVAMVEIFGKRMMRGFVTSRILEAPQGYREKMPFLVLRFLVGMLGTAFVLVVVTVAALIIFGKPDDLSVEITVAAIYLAFFLTRTVGDLWRMILSPYLSQYRIPQFTDKDARRLYLWLWAIASYGIWSGYFVSWIREIGLNYNVYALLGMALAFVGALANIVMVVVNAKAISRALRSGRPLEETTWVTRMIVSLWAPALIAFFAFGWLRYSYDLVLERDERIPLVVGGYGVLLTMIVVYAVMNYGLERYFERVRRREDVNRSMAQAEAEEAMTGMHTHRPMTYEELFRQVAGILALAAGSYALVLIWLPENRLINETLIGNSLDVAIILFAGYIAYNLFRIWIDGMIAPGNPHRGRSRVGR